MNIIPEKTPTGLSDAELLKIRTEVQASSAREQLERARACLAEPWTHDELPYRVGSLGYYAKALADELERVLEREQEWIRAAAQLDGAQREVLRQALGDAVAWHEDSEPCGSCQYAAPALCAEHAEAVAQRDAYVKLARALGIEVQR